MSTETGAEFSILITDDDSACRESLRDIMEPEGYQTLTASCGEEALEIVEHHEVHLVLSDMNMPRLTGLEMIQLVRQMYENLPCILVTGEPTESLIRQARLAQVYSVIPKPVSKHVVLYTVVKALDRFYRQQ